MTEPMELPVGLEVVLGEHLGDDPRSVPLLAALRAREDMIGDILRVTGVQQFGLYPEVVAEVLAEVGLGSPLSPEARDLVHRNFHSRMEQWQADIEEFRRRYPDA